MDDDVADILGSARPCMGVTSTPGKGSTFWFTFHLKKAETQLVEVRQVSSVMCPILVVAPNTTTRNMLTGYLKAWGADVAAAVGTREAAESYLDRDLPTVTAILSLSLPKWRGLTLTKCVNKPLSDKVRLSGNSSRLTNRNCPFGRLLH